MLILKMLYFKIKLLSPPLRITGHDQHIISKLPLIRICIYGYLKLSLFFFFPTMVLRHSLKSLSPPTYTHIAAHTSTHQLPCNHCDLAGVAHSKLLLRHSNCTHLRI